jgi:hypothetical protein
MQCEADVVIVEHPRGEMLLPFRLDHSVPDGHVGEVSMMDHSLDGYVDLTNRRKRPGLDRSEPCGIEALEEQPAARREMEAARRELGVAYRVVRDIDEIACQKHHVKGAAEAQPLYVAADPVRRVGHVAQHVARVVDCSHHAAFVQEVPGEATRTAAELEDRALRRELRGAQFQLAAVWEIEINLDCAAILCDDASTLASRGLEFRRVLGTEHIHAG